MLRDLLVGRILLVAALVICLTPVALATPPRYLLTPITGSTVPASPISSHPYALNEQGDVVGIAQFAPNENRAFHYSAQSTNITNLGAHGGWISYGNDINESGWIVGGSVDTANRSHAFIVKNGVATPLTFTIPGVNIREIGASSINDQGIVTGAYTAFMPTAGRVAEATFLYDANTMTLLDTVTLSPNGPSAISNTGIVVGAYQPFPSTSFHAFYYSNDIFQPLESSGSPLYSSFAYDVNDAGWAVGEATVNFETITTAAAFVNGQVINLGSLAPQRNSDALGINNHGVIVGRSGHAGEINGFYHGFVHVDGAMYDLNTLIDNPAGFVIKEAWDINNAGQIVASAREPNGRDHAVLLTPVVPEPGTMLLVAIGAAMFTCYRVRVIANR